ncbi:TRAP transporter substrate-binding protein [Acuticoccus mangrovi]|uniref:TRAP transporter substrate-binding protein n=1 Tax=Acuticoccus mangrovi TaxID=2796142 RepID=A0A934IH64_9HYPH|nr:TRAP transporter substrate-binding protein [Acuticoccus mangrovi]MBJ3774916.1 TRAP transporter substrate-binding protein [Acuticoccus mangrovi]
MRFRIAATALAIAMAAAPAQAQTVMKMASATINDVQHEFQKVFKRELEATVGDAITVEIYPASQLGPIPQMAEGVAFGTIESFISPTSFLTPLDPKFQVFDVPGLFASPDELSAVIHDPDYRDHIETMFLDRGLRVIGAIYNSPVLILTRKPVETVADMKGLKVRTFASPLQVLPMEAVGAIATPLPLSEVVPQLQSGGIDGMLAGMPILTAFKFYDIAKNVTDLDFSFIVSMNVVNEQWFQSQAPEIQEAIRQAGRAAEAEVFPWGVENVARANGVWTDNGGMIHQLPADELKAMLAEFESIGAEVVTAEPATAEEYERLQGVLKAKREAN